MPITQPLRFLATGKPMRVNVNPRLNREPSRKGVSVSGVRKVSEFQQIRKQEFQPSTSDLGRKAVQVSKSQGISVNITI